MKQKVWVTIAFVLTCICGEALAQRLSVQPSPRDGLESSCVVEGLNPAGDNFLSIRSGPGTRYRKVGEVYTGYTINIERPCPTRNWYFADSIFTGNGQSVPMRG